MAKKRRFHPTVADDLKFATDYYDDISVDLGNRFRSAFRDRLRTCRNAQSLLAAFTESCVWQRFIVFPMSCCSRTATSLSQFLASSMLPLIRVVGSSVRCEAGGVQHGFYARPLAHLPCLATRAGLGTISGS